MNERISREKFYAEAAKLVSERGICGRLKVGCVAISDGRIVATGYNGPLGGESHCSSGVCDITKPCERAIHAEANLIAFSASSGIPLKGCTLYVTHSPCLKCAELIIQAGIKKVVFLENFRSREGVELLDKHHIEVSLYNSKK